MLTQAVDSLSRLSPAAIHDTVAAIARQDAYQQRLTRSLAERFWVWLWDHIRALYDAVAGTPAARSVALVVAVLLLATILFRVAYAARFERRPRRLVMDAAGRATRALPTLDEARRLADAGHVADAVHVLYAAVVDVLAQQRSVRPHLSKTSGDFARELRARGHPSYDAFRLFVRRFDRVFFGHDSCDHQAFAALYADAERVVRAATLAGAA